MEYKVLDMISQEIKANRKVALATIVKSDGSSPRKEGSMMGIKEDGTIFGTVGGGTLELVVTEQALKCMVNNTSKTFSFKLTDEEGSIHMQCGGEVDVFIKTFTPTQRLIIVGGGHISLELYKVSKQLGFYTVIVEDREEFCNKERFPKADELIVGDIENTLLEYTLGKNCYVVIVTRGHVHDETALKTVINSDATYVGMIGSKNKTKFVMEKLIKEGFSQESIDKVYAPIGINLGGETPEEIALSIISEILLVKNQGSLSHMKDIKAK